MSITVKTMALGLLAFNMSAAANAQVGGSILDLKTAMTSYEVTALLDLKGFEHKSEVVTYKFDPDHKIDSFLQATRTTENTVRDEIFIGFDKHPQNSRAAIITRQVIYKGGEGPTLNAVNDQLKIIMGESPTQVDRSSSRMTYDYHWGKDDKFISKAKVFNKVDSCKMLFSAVTGYERAKSSKYFERSYVDVGNDGVGKHSGVYSPKCYKIARVHVSMDKNTQLVSSLDFYLMNNTQIHTASQELTSWADAQNSLYIKKLRESAKTPDL